MPTTLLMLLVFLSAQLGDRYPVEPPATGSETPAQADVGTESWASTVAEEEPASATDGLFNEAQPLNSQPLNVQQTPPLESPPATEPKATTPPNTVTSQTTTPPKTAEPESETDPAKVLASFLEPPLESQLKGTPLTLAQAVNNSPSRAEQTQRVIAYWELSQAVANYYLSYKERIELAALRQSVTLPSSDWDAARQTAEDRLRLAQDRVRVAQEYLTQLMGNAPLGFAPLPSDLPFCGLYETRYGQIFQSRASTVAEQLNEFLPRAHKDLLYRTQEISDSRRWMLQVSDNRSPQTDGNELLRVYELFAARRRAFLGAVKEYNLGIVRYTEIATPGTLETERLVAMLIRTGGSQGTTFDADVQRANAEETADPNDSSSIQPKGPGVSEWQGVPNTGLERSILVPRG